MQAEACKMSKHVDFFFFFKLEGTIPLPCKEPKGTKDHKERGSDHLKLPIV